MNKDFFGLMKEIAIVYGVEVIENASKGGIFYKDEDNNLVEVSKQKNYLIIEDFCMSMGVDLIDNKDIYAVEHSVLFAA